MQIFRHTGMINNAIAERSDSAIDVVSKSL